MSQKAKQDTEMSDKPSATVKEEGKVATAAVAPGGVGERQGGRGEGEAGAGTGESDVGRGELEQGDQKYYGKKKGTRIQATRVVYFLVYFLHSTPGRMLIYTVISVSRYMYLACGYCHWAGPRWCIFPTFSPPFPSPALPKVVASRSGFRWPWSRHDRPLNLTETDRETVTGTVRETVTTPPPSTPTGDTSEEESEIEAEIGTVTGGARGGLTAIATTLLPATCTASTQGAMGITRERGRGARGELRMGAGEAVGIKVREVGVAAGDVTGGILLQVPTVSSNVCLKKKYILLTSTTFCKCTHAGSSHVPAYHYPPSMQPSYYNGPIQGGTGMFFSPYSGPMFYNTPIIPVDETTLQDYIRKQM